MVSPTIRLGGRRVPVVLPRLTDARLHTAGVVMTIHVLGQVALDFAVSVPQIAVAIVTAAALEVVITFRATRQLVWPASAMLTGSGVGLIMRAVGTEPGDHWSWHRWYLFAAVAGGSLLTKYAIRWHGRHVFNPSNIGLVAAFLLLGSGRVEPLPFWWHPIGPAMLLAYAVVIVGGVLITQRLELLGMAVACWLALVAGVGVQARAGHCVIVPWSDLASCGSDLWWVIATSPEVLVFLFFMLTDPRTVPTSRRGRIWFAVAVGASAAALIAPQRTEFGAKVGLLGALTVVTAAVPVAQTVVGRARRAGWFAPGRSETVGLAVGVLVPALVVAWIGVQFVLGSDARRAVALPVAAAELPALDAFDWTPPADLPGVTVDERALELDPSLADERSRDEVIVGLLRALAGEEQALAQRRPELLAGIAHGRRLSNQIAALADVGGGPLDVAVRTVESGVLTVVRPAGQGGALLAVDAVGTVIVETRGADGDLIAASVARPFREVFALRPASDGRLLIADVAAP